MSLKPGIARDWFQKFSTDVFPHDRIVVRGKASKPPKFYDKLYIASACDNNFELAQQIDGVFFDRIEKAKLSLDDNTPDRLGVKEQVTLAKLSRFKRSLV